MSRIGNLLTRAGGKRRILITGALVLGLTAAGGATGAALGGHDDAHGPRAGQHQGHRPDPAGPGVPGGNDGAHRPGPGAGQRQGQNQGPNPTDPGASR